MSMLSLLAIFHPPPPLFPCCPHPPKIHRGSKCYREVTFFTHNTSGAASTVCSQAFFLISPCHIALWEMEQSWEVGCTRWSPAAASRTPKLIHWKEERLFWLTVSENPVCDLILFLWSYAIMVHNGKGASDSDCSPHETEEGRDRGYSTPSRTHCSTLTFPH